MARKGLGKGLSGELFEGQGLAALLGEEDAGGVMNLRLSRVEPRRDQPRTYFDPEALDELAESIKAHGIIQPITVRKTEGDYYEIIAGERRWRAAKLAGLREIPAIVIRADDKKTAELAMVENLQREDLSPIEEARGYRSLMDAYGYTQEAAAERVGKSRPVVANALRLLSLPEGAQRLVEEKKLPLSHARIILSLENAADMEIAAAEVAEKGLSVKETEKLVKRLSTSKERAKSGARTHSDGVDYFGEVERELTKALGRKVTVAPGAKKGKFEIEYYGTEDFEQVYAALLGLKTGGKNE